MRKRGREEREAAGGRSYLVEHYVFKFVGHRLELGADRTTGAAPGGRKVYHHQLAGWQGLDGLVKFGFRLELHHHGCVVCVGRRQVKVLRD